MASRYNRCCGQFIFPRHPVLPPGGYLFRVIGSIGETPVQPVGWVPCEVGPRGGKKKSRFTLFLPHALSLSHNRRRRAKNPTGPSPVLPSPAPKGRSPPRILLPSISSSEWIQVPLLLLSLWAHTCETLDGRCRHVGDLLSLEIVRNLILYTRS